MIDICKEMIKPSISTPLHLKNYSLSSMDQLLPRNYIPQVFFFPNNTSQNSDEKSRRLKHSLSEALSAYYPFAGRLVKSRSYVDCNDEGVEFQEAKILCTLSDYLEKYEQDLNLDLVFPPNSVWETFKNDSSLMIVRVNYFECGGIAIAMCLSHIIADACTFSTFINYWAAVTRQSGDQISPHIVFSPSNQDDFVVNEFSPKDVSLIRKRYVFKNTELANLKAKVCSSDDKIPTRVEFLAVLFFKCFVNVEITKTGSFTPSALQFLINMRSKMDPQLPETTFGNWIYSLYVASETESKLKWSLLLDEIKNEKKNVEGLKELNTSEQLLRASHYMKHYKFYTCTSLCNLGSYDISFGWGNPVRVVLAHNHVKDWFVFQDTPTRDGIEVLISGQQQEMMKHQLEAELRALASRN